MKRAACFLLALILVFSVVMPITTVQAVTGLDDAIAIPLVVKLLIASGLTFTSVSVAENVAQDFYSNPDNASLVGQNILLGKPFWTSTLDRLQLSFVVLDALWDAVIGYRDANFSEGTNEIVDSSGAVVISGVENVQEYVVNNTQIAHLYYGVVMPYFTITKETGEVWHCWIEETSPGAYHCTYGYSAPYSERDSTSVYWTWNSSLGGIYVYWVVGGSKTLVSNVNAVSIGAAIPVGNVYGESVCADGAWDYSNPYTGERSIDVPLVKEVPGVGTIGIGEDVYGLDTDALEDGYTDTYEDVTTEVAGVIPATEAQEIDTAGETDWTGTQEPGSESNTSLKALFFSKFPFCLPWDLMNAVKLLGQEPEAPYWEIDLMAPIEANRGISFAGDTTIRLDMADYPIVGQVFRWTSLVGFTIALIAVTRKIIWS